jgi:hypothetical protein
LIALLAVGLYSGIPYLIASESTFSWLRSGAYALYSIGSNRGEFAPYVGFDDMAFANPVLGNYSWRCLKVNGKYAELEVEVNITVWAKPGADGETSGSVVYTGKEFLQKAQQGDLSFIKRIPKDQVEGRIELVNMSEFGDEYYAVRIPAPVYIYKKLSVTVDLDTMELVDENRAPWGKWALWINPLRYQLTGRTLETFIMNWLNTTVSLYVLYENGTGPSVDSAIGRFERYFVAGHPPIENPDLLKLGTILNPPAIVLTYAYEPRVGILLGEMAGTYLDDVLTQELGIIYTLGQPALPLVETNISIESNASVDLQVYLPTLAVLAISITVVSAYFIRKRYRVKH